MDDIGPTELDLRELALAVEWEGTVGLYRAKTFSKLTSKWYTYYQPVVSVGQVTERVCLLERLQKLAGGVGRIGGMNATKRRSGERAMSSWQVNGPEAVELARKLAPYLITKAEQARIVAAYVVGRQGVKTSPEALAAREAAYQRTLQLNHVGQLEPDPAWESLTEGWMKWISGASEAERMQLLASAIDLEGCITVGRHKNPGHHGVTHSPMIQITQVERRGCLLKVAQTLSAGAGLITKHCNSGTANSVPALFWHMAGPAVASLAGRLAPFLTAKGYKARALAEFPTFGEVTSNGRDPMPDWVFAKREEIYRAVVDKKEPPVSVLEAGGC